MKRTRFFMALPVLLLLAAGCGSEAGDGEFSATERARRTVDPRVGTFLIEAQRAYERGAYVMALALSDSAEYYAPDLADVHYLRGVIYTDMNRLDIAQAAFNTVLELDPAYKGVRYNLGLNAFRRGALRDAITLYRAEQELEATSGLMLELGRAYAKLGEPDSAQVAYRQAIALDSTNATVYMWLGQLLEENGDLEAALEASRAGLRLKPDNLDYRYIIGSLLLRTGEVAEAAEHLEPVAKARSWHHGAQYNLGQVFMRLGRETDAQFYFARADSAQQLQQQINEAQNAINRDPETLEHWTDLGELLRRSGQLERAVEAYKVAVTIDPWNLHLQNNLAIMMMETGNAEGAIRRYKAILGLDSTMANVWLNLGVAYANTGREVEARAAWQNTLKHEPGHRAARTFLAQLDASSDAQ